MRVVAPHSQPTGGPRLLAAPGALLYTPPTLEDP